ncbi:MAG: fibronectin type III domain-containing protein [Myxococcales bacterium]|nr:fibronectin type III domain-containing protein [Myxococcales bacterium]
MFAFSLTFSLLAACDDHKGDEEGTQATTHPATHSGGDTGGTTADQPTTSAGEGTGTTAAAAEPPAAPTDLMLSILEGGVHTTWKDASDNEDNFILEKKAAGDPDFAVVIELPFDSVTYHDIDVVPGTMYTYRVKAVNAGGESLSNEAMIQVP